MMKGGSVSRILYLKLVQAPHKASIIYLMQPTPRQRASNP